MSIKTGKIIRTPIFDPGNVYNNLESEKRLTSSIKRSVAFSEKDYYLFKVTPLQRRTLAELISRSKNRCSIKDILGDNNYNLVNELLNEEDIKRASATLKEEDLTAAYEGISELSKMENERTTKNEKSGEEFGKDAEQSGADR